MRSKNEASKQRLIRLLSRLAAGGLHLELGFVHSTKFRSPRRAMSGDARRRMVALGRRAELQLRRRPHGGIAKEAVQRLRVLAHVAEAHGFRAASHRGAHFGLCFVQFHVQLAQRLGHCRSHGTAVGGARGVESTQLFVDRRLGLRAIRTSDTKKVVSVRCVRQVVGVERHVRVSVIAENVSEVRQLVRHDFSDGAVAIERAHGCSACGGSRSRRHHEHDAANSLLSWHL
mmetsp:Transcript_17936/g.63352  ORF Transcript_17936/g.63352 Transcript_17936/m.63352 type:complete len:230 (-) Transcript_17936:180-869(-)